MDNQQTQAHHPKTDYTIDNSKNQNSEANEQSTTGGLGGIGDKLSAAVSGDTEGSGESQGLLDKGISYLQQSITGKGNQDQVKGTDAQGDSSHHAAVEEAHPEKISEFLRHQNRSMAEKDGK